MRRLPIAKQATSYTLCVSTLRVATHLADHYGARVNAVFEWIIREDTPRLLRATPGMPLRPTDAVPSEAIRALPALAYPQAIHCGGKREKLSVSISVKAFELVLQTHELHGIYASQLVEWLIYYHAARAEVLDLSPLASWRLGGEAAEPNEVT